MKITLLRGLVALALVATPLPARADAWQPTDFQSPADKAAHGLASEAVGVPDARLVVGCETATANGWRGVAIWRSAHQKVDARDVEVVVSFFGRAPVTERWQRRLDDGGRVVLWPGASENLRRNLLREDVTRGQASVTVEIREVPGAPVKLVFGVDGLAERGAELGEACHGWGTDKTYKRRERGW